MELQKCAAWLVLASSCRDRGAAWSDSPSWNPQLWRPGSAQLAAHGTRRPLACARCPPGLRVELQLRSLHSAAWILSEAPPATRVSFA